MYNISVPIMINDRLDREVVLSKLKSVGASRVFLALREHMTQKLGITKQDLDEITDLVNYFEENGIEAAVWIGWTMGHGSSKNYHSYTRQVDINFNVLNGTYCALDDEFRKDFCEYITAIAKTGVKTILLDDDFRVSFKGGISCFCHKHTEEFNKRAKTNFTDREIKAAVFDSEPNEYRKIWMEINHDSLLRFSNEIRAAANKADKNIRVGLCAAPSTWDIDGIDSITLSKALAGETKPLLRLIGAPYWAALEAWGNNLASVIEVERLEKYYAKDENIEIISEGDTYPRPRAMTPASYLECFDTALRASGGFDGILKYMVDYNSSHDYEPVYIEKSQKHIPLYKQIEKAFSDKTAVGINVFEAMNKLANADVRGKSDIENIFFPIAPKLLAANSISITYGNTSLPTIAFGENGKYVPTSLSAYILDFYGAKYLSERGVDVGISEFGDGYVPSRENYIKENEAVNLPRTNVIYHKVTPSGSADIESTFDGNTASFTYTNKDGQKFLIFTFSPDFNSRPNAVFNSYCRQRQLVKAMEFFGSPLDAVCTGNPNLYIQTKKNNSSLAVGLWNFFADEIDCPQINLSDKYSKCEFINCTGEIKDNKVYLSTLYPYQFAGVVLSK